MSAADPAVATRCAGGFYVDLAGGWRLTATEATFRTGGLTVRVTASVGHTDGADATPPVMAYADTTNIASGEARRKFLRQVAKHAPDGVPVVDTASHAPLLVLEAALRQAAAEAAQAPPDPGTRPTHGYDYSGGVTSMQKAEGLVRIANAVGRITRQIHDDDGFDGETRCTIELAVDIAGIPGTRTLAVPAPKFHAGTWAGDLGGDLNIKAGQGYREHFRAAIQYNSPSPVPTVKRYGHTGWRFIDGAWYYLHAGGALGAKGTRTDVLTAIGGALADFRLPPVPDHETLRDACRRSLTLFDLGPKDVMWPLLLLPFLAALVELLDPFAPDFTMVLVGQTGQGKSELAVLPQQFFGAGFSRGRLPASYEDTPNAIEYTLAMVKDALTVIDDHPPTSSPRKQAQYAEVQERLFRSGGNRSARHRLDRGSHPLAAYYPRGLALTTVEGLSAAQSNLARVLAVHVPRGAVSVTRFRAFRAQAPAYSVTMAGFLQDVAARWTTLRESLPRRFEDLREKASANPSHTRDPGRVAHFRIAAKELLGYCERIGAVAADRASTLLDEAGVIVGALVSAHGAEIAQESPGDVFCRLLLTLFRTRRAYLENIRGGALRDDDNPEAWGYFKDASDEYRYRHEPHASLLGYLRRDGKIALDPQGTFRALYALEREMGRTYPGDHRAMCRMLLERGWAIWGMDKDGKRTIPTHPQRTPASAGGRVLLLDVGRMLIETQPSEEEIKSAEKEEAEAADAAMTRAPSNGRRGNGAAPGRPDEATGDDAGERKLWQSTSTKTPTT